MNEDDFRELAETFGADVERWPERFRSEATAAARQPWAAAVLRETALFDDFIGTAGPVVEKRRAERSITAVNARIAAQMDQPLRFTWIRSLASPLAGMVAAGLLGAYLGLSGVTVSGASDASLADLLAAAFSYSDPSFFMMGG